MGCRWYAGETLRHNGIAYRGINTVLLWMTAAEHGYSSNYWMSFRQAQELGGNVRKGEKGTLVVYAKAIERKETDDEGEEVERRIPFMKGYSVFSADQIDGLPQHYYAVEAKPSSGEGGSALRLRIASSPISALTSAMAATKRSIIPPATLSKCLCLMLSFRLRRTPGSWRTNPSIGRRRPPASTETLAAKSGATKVTPRKSWSPYPDSVILSQNQAWGGIIGGSDGALQTSGSSVPAA